MARRKAKPPAWPVLWFTATVCGTPWRFMFATPNEDPDLKTDDGNTVLPTSTVFIAHRFASQPERAAEIALHELEHIVGEMSGARFMVHDDDTDKEERAIRIYSPARYAALQSAGLLAFPPIPPLPPVTP